MNPSLSHMFGERRSSDVQEVPLLLPNWQLAALESAASARGLTAAQMMRHVLSTYFDHLPECVGAGAGAEKEDAAPLW